MFGQLVIGPPGSGKTTYCAGMQQFLQEFGREVAVVNLDPANDMMKYKPDIDITDLITISDVMDTLKLGPNGGLVYCMEYLEQNMSWLEEELARVKGRYLLIDCPGQVELYTHNTAVHNIVQRLIKMDIRLVAVHLVDSHYCSDASKFISVLLTSLTTMLQMELPHVNVLSKCDLIQKYGKLAFNLDFYTEVLDLSYILDQFKEEEEHSRYKKLNAAIVDIVQDYSLVSFVPLFVEDKEIMLRVMKAVDKANGYVFGDLEERNLQEMLSCAAGAEFEYEKIQNIQEHFVDDSAGTSTENG
ncbi:GPN-loop GTPase 2-like isoform X2 [Mya arenaria]|nr:GPN-loop GTPase 2-like isoform X2 [Mya arenaria]XP_052796691.1 GPN-loop GTPase 2-like isoform X2 [Mya arenaria]XP_052796692.1 GPN-loop GTPase 2-like isoform X2 [Mya arenaria]XP_052796693.1 GPN-loop GTPase 2-like isoform X2 [Mya arenaria]XP_052796694.1 GPN-loop GTPase 2-like isoform X2 [Mya arenaria]XP_052796695.1 GPN-loop GTPase 2-like isoform X2 [Mya arenaria]XP_052796696.1 GPN-loop GTPase 2-like isoform X2 [Mya arenaria]